jgi:class 3 adenylate cyclase
MGKKNIRVILLVWDIVAIILISFSLIMMFETLIKGLLLDANTHVFTEVTDDVQAEYRNAMEFIAEKSALPYGESLKEVFSHLKDLALSNLKYDRSLVMILGPDTAFPGEIGRRNAQSQPLTAAGLDYRYFHLAAAGIPGSLSAAEIANIGRLTDDTGRKYLSAFYKSDAAGQPATLQGFPNADEALMLRRALTTDKTAPGASSRRVEFTFQGRGYVGTAGFLNVPVGRGLVRNAIETWNPVLVVADDKDDFFFLINNVRNLFLAVMGGIVILILFIKLYNTNLVTREIRTIAGTIRDESTAISRKGEVGTALTPLDPKFGETATLFDSYTGLNAKLAEVGGIMSGIADRDLFTATLKNDRSLLEPHEVNMAILFLDVQGFTAVSEKHKEKAMSIINRIWAAVEEATAARSGKINKYMGDAALVIFPEASSAPPARRAVETALDVIERVPMLRGELGIDFNFRLGIDYGKLVYGKTGSAAKYELGVIGDPVNTAARCEALNKKFGTTILITGEALKNAGLTPEKTFAGRERRSYTPFLIDSARPKGKQESKELFTVLAKETAGFRIVGADAAFAEDCLEAYARSLADLQGGIALWREKSGKDGPKKWAVLARAFGRIWLERQFPPARMFLGRLLSSEEQARLQNDPAAWLKQAELKIRVPDADWIESGAVELEK